MKSKENEGASPNKGTFTTSRTGLNVEIQAGKIEEAQSFSPGRLSASPRLRTPKHNDKVSRLQNFWSLDWGRYIEVDNSDAGASDSIYQPRAVELRRLGFVEESRGNHVKADASDVGG